MAFSRLLNCVPFGTVKNKVVINICHMFSLLSNELKVKVSVAQKCSLFAMPWTVAHLAPLSMEFSRQEHWSGLPFSSPLDLPSLGIEPRSLQADSLLLKLCLISNAICMGLLLFSHSVVSNSC